MADYCNTPNLWVHYGQFKVFASDISLAFASHVANVLFFGMHLANVLQMWLPTIPEISFISISIVISNRTIKDLLNSSASD